MLFDGGFLSLSASVPEESGYCVSTAGPNNIIQQQPTEMTSKIDGFPGSDMLKLLRGTAAWHSSQYAVRDRPGGLQKIWRTSLGMYCPLRGKR